ncbi:MAG TPA: DJ-1/PfpI family protein [Victivallales bacterium]|nr:DJ-1/PfpI family protein [Victivallales bacterium]
MDNNKLNLGAVLFNGFEQLDIFGPLEMFALLNMLEKQVNIITLGINKTPVKSNYGPSVSVDHTFEENMPIDILLIPGGIGTRTKINDEDLLHYLKQYAQSASYVSTVCTGSALLAKTGLLDNLRATTNKLAFNWVTEQSPAVKWIPEARWVEDGKFFTSSGVSAGMDMSLGLIEKIFDRSISLKVANYAEYKWNEDKTSDPFAKLTSLTSKKHLK